MFKFRKREKPEELRCSFCNKSKDEVEKLISNPSDMRTRVFICNECVHLCNVIIEEPDAASRRARLVRDIKARNQK